VIGNIFNLIAAILCTIGAAVSAAAMFLSESTFVNLLSGVGCSIATLGGLAWIVAAAIPVLYRQT
jgi:hypothetical protein